MIQIAIMGISLGINIIVILYKWRKQRYLDATIDGSILALIGFIFQGTISGLMIGTIGSSVVSIYLLIFPPKLNIGELLDEQTKEG